MKFVPFLLGLIGSIVISFAVVLFNQLTGLEIHSLSILYVIPLGGILLGALGAVCFYFGRKMTNTKILKVEYIHAVALSLLTFICVNYISYSNTYIFIDTNDQTKVLYQFSQPEDYTSINQIISFGDYMNMINSSTSNQLKKNDGTKLGDDFEAGETTTSLLFYLQILGAIIGSAGVVLYFRTKSKI